MTDARSARFTDDGSAAIVVTKTSAMERVDLTTHAVTVLQSSGVLRLHHLSGDGNWATYMHTYDSMSNRYDIWLTDARNAGTTPVALDATLTTLLFSTFTADSASALYVVDVDTNKWTGSLRARPVAGGPERIIATADEAVPVGGSRIVYTENVTGSYPDVRADISILDLAGGAPTKIATQAYHRFDVLADGATLVYLQPGEGLHVAKLP